MFNTILFGYLLGWLVFLLLINNFLKYLNKFRRPYRQNQAVDILLRVAKKLPPMPQSPMNIVHQCLSLLLPTENICRYFTESYEIFIAHATITDGYFIGDYRWKYRRSYFVGKVLVGKNFFAHFAVGVCFFNFQ